MTNSDVIVMIYLGMLVYVDVLIIRLLLLKHVEIHFPVKKYSGELILTKFLGVDVYTYDKVKELVLISEVPFKLDDTSTAYKVNHHEAIYKFVKAISYYESYNIRVSRGNCRLIYRKDQMEVTRVVTSLGVNFIAWSILAFSTVFIIGSLLALFR